MHEVDFSAPVPAVDIQARAELLRRLATPTSPILPLERGDLGRAADILAFLAATQGTSSPRPLIDARLITVASSPAARVTQAYLEGSQATAEEVDATDLDVADALAAGAQALDRAVDSGCDLIIPVAADTDRHAATALACLGALTRREPVSLVDFLDADVARWQSHVADVRDAMFAARTAAGDPQKVLDACATPEFAMLVGAMAQAAIRRTPIILDGLVTAAAACLAEALSQGTRNWMLAGVLTPYPAHKIALQRLGLKGLFAMNLPLGAGSGALTTLGMVQATARLINTPKEPEAEEPQAEEPAPEEPNAD